MSVGFHAGAPVVENMLKAMEERKMHTFQFFTHGPKSLTQNKYDAEAIAKIVKSGVRVYVHSAYVTSWQKEGTVFMQLEACDEIGAAGLVLHIPKVLPDAAAEMVRKMLGRYKTPLLLEMRAMRPSADSYESPEKIIALIRALEKLGIKNTQARICIDTAHIYAGRMEIKTQAEATKYLDALKDVWGWIGLLHLNGNEVNCYTKAADKHCAPVGKTDYVWDGVEYEDSGCRVFVERFVSSGIDIILEQPIDSAESLEFWDTVHKIKVEKIETKTQAETKSA